MSTVHAVLDRNELVNRKTRWQRNLRQGTPLTAPTNPNRLWCADIKGEFMLADKRYCYPLTITDFSSRYLLACEGLESTKEASGFAVFENTFKDLGVPDAIRTDNGVPFASPNALYNLSKLSVWWFKFGIAIERIQPGKPQQNGRQERMHRTLKAETTRPGLYGPTCRHQTSRRPNLARQLLELRCWVFRRHERAARANQKSIRCKSVIYVLGKNCNPSDRFIPW